MLGIKYKTSLPHLNGEKDVFILDEADVFLLDKDFFIEMAQEALEQVKLEEEQKGVLYELIEALLNRTVAPMITEQLKSQDVIERLAEDHYSNSKSLLCSEDIIISPNTLKEESSDEEEIEIQQQNYTNSYHTVSECIWRLFRLLLLASLVGLVYHFLCNHTKLLLEYLN